MLLHRACLTVVLGLRLWWNLDRRDCFLCLWLGLGLRFGVFLLQLDFQMTELCAVAEKLLDHNPLIHDRLALLGYKQ